MYIVVLYIILIDIIGSRVSRQRKIIAYFTLKIVFAVSISVAHIKLLKVLIKAKRKCRIRIINMVFVFFFLKL